MQQSRAVLPGAPRGGLHALESHRRSIPGSAILARMTTALDDRSSEIAVLAGTTLCLFRLEQWSIDGTNRLIPCCVRLDRAGRVRVPDLEPRRREVLMELQYSTSGKHEASGMEGRDELSRMRQVDPSDF